MSAFSKRRKGLTPLLLLQNGTVHLLQHSLINHNNGDSLLLQIMVVGSSLHYHCHHSHLNLKANHSFASVSTDRPLTSPQIVVFPPTTSRQHIPSGVVIPPLPTYPPPELPSAMLPLGQAGTINPVVEASPLLSRPSSSSAAGLQITLTDSFSTLCSSPSAEQALVPQQSFFDGRGLEDIYGDRHESHPRLRMVSSLGVLPLNRTVVSRSKSFFKGVIRRYQ